MTKTAPGPGSLAGDRPYPTRTGRLPRHLDEVTAQWLTGLLRHRYPGVSVQRLHIVHLRNSHTTKLRLALDLAHHEGTLLPDHVCLKSNWSEGFESGNICELEARFYRFMRDRTDAPLPRSFYEDWDADGGGRGIVVMEDLAQQGGNFGHSTDHLGIEGVASALESLARLHAAYWGNVLLEDQQWLPASMDTEVDTDQLYRMYRYMQLNMGKPEYSKVLPAWLYETPEIFAHAYDSLAAIERELRTPRCLVHGDAHQGNSFLRHDSQRVWYDWQLVRRGHPARDVTYFMIGALTVEERRHAERGLLEHYRAALLTAGARDAPSAEELWWQYRRWPVYGMQAWLANVDSWGQGGLPMVERFFVAAADLETIPLLTAHACVPVRQRKLGEGARAVTTAIKRLHQTDTAP